MIVDMEVGRTVEVIEEERPVRRFMSKITSKGLRRPMNGMPSVPWVHIGAGNGSWGLTVQVEDIKWLASVIRDRPPRLYVVLSRDMIDGARAKDEYDIYMRSTHPEPRGDRTSVGRINGFHRFEIGESIRVYAKAKIPDRVYTVQRRVSPDWTIQATSPLNNTVVISQKGMYQRYADITVELHQMMRDVNGHLRAYIDGKDLVPVGLLKAYRNITAEEEHHNMAMSHDRVEFQLGPFRPENRETPTVAAVVRAAHEAFGLETAEAAALFGYGEPVILRVRPSQFARFLILRDRYGGTNDFKGLKANLVPEEPTPTRIDVSKRQNTVR